MQKRAFSFLTRHLILLFVASMCFTNCSKKPDERLTKVDQLTSSAPEEAVDSLANIDYDLLSDADKQYHDFLTIKTKDKAFIHHSSDTLVLKVIANESKHKGRGRYPEALYYGGRVYHDLGDMPTALHYYQNALDLLDNDYSQIQLKAKVLSHMGGLLHSLRLYDQAISCLTDVIRIDSIQNDSINYMYDIESLGSVNLNAKNYVSAEYYFRKAKNVAKKLNSKDSIGHNMYLAAIKLHKNELDSALILIRPTVANIDSLYRNVALAYACNIYKRAGVLDTALIYAQDLIRRNKTYNRLTGYQTILSDELVDYTPTDSLLKYLFEYRDLTESYLDQNGNQEALFQTSFYNYQKHLRENIKSEKKNKVLTNCLWAFFVILLLSLVCILYLKYRNKSHQLQIQQTNEIVNQLREELKYYEAELSKNISEYISRPDIDTTSPKIQQLREKLFEKYKSLSSALKTRYVVPNTILESEAYKKIQKFIKDDRVIPDSNPVWQELENAISETSPDFIHLLRVLSNGSISKQEIYLTLLIKCGISTTNIAKLLGITKQGIVYRKNNIINKIFGEKLERGAFDSIIHLL